MNLSFKNEKEEKYAVPGNLSKKRSGKVKGKWIPFVFFFLVKELRFTSFVVRRMKFKMCVVVFPFFPHVTQEKY